MSARFDFSRVKADARAYLRQNRRIAVKAALPHALYFVLEALFFVAVLAAGLSAKSPVLAFLLLYLIAFVPTVMPLVLGFACEAGSAARSLYNARHPGEASDEGVLTAYNKVTGTLFLRQFFASLWRQIPVVGYFLEIKYLMRLSMVSYVMKDLRDADLGYIGHQKIFDMSTYITNGHKGQLFLFEVAFFLLRWLGVLTLGIANVLWIEPYYQTVKAMAYDSLKAEALCYKRVAYADFGLAEPEDASTPDAPKTAPKAVPIPKKTCRYCGFTLREGAKMCDNCGARL